MQWNGVRARRRAGVAPRVCGSIGNGRGMEARQGAIRIFGEIPIPPSSSPARRRPPATSAGAGLHEHPMRDLAKPGSARRPGACPQRFARGDGSRDRASDEAGMVGCGALRRERCSRKKCGWSHAGLQSVYRSRRPQGSPVRPARADVQDTVSRMVNPPPLPPCVVCNEIRDEPLFYSAPPRDGSFAVGTTPGVRSGAAADGLHQLVLAHAAAAGDVELLRALQQVRLAAFAQGRVLRAPGRAGRLPGG
jgi:hypothetical protein